MNLANRQLFPPDLGGVIIACGLAVRADAPPGLIDDGAPETAQAFGSCPGLFRRNGTALPEYEKETGR